MRNSSPTGVPRNGSEGKVGRRGEQGSSEAALGVGGVKERAVALSGSDFTRVFFRELPGLFWATGPDGGCAAVSAEWLRFVGRRGAGVLGEGWMESIHPEDRPSFRETFRRAFVCRAPFEAEHRLWRHDGVYRWVVNSGRPYRVSSGSFGGYVGFCLDVTKRRQGEAETRRACRELEAFSYSVSHDLRAPLRALAGFSEAVLADSADRLDASGRDALGRVVETARQMDRLIGDLLAFSRVIRGRVERVAVDPEGVVAEVLHRLGHQTARVRVEPLPAVLAHPVLLGQIFQNLLSNAFKFVAPGVVPEVRVRAERRGRQVRFWVEDNGIGIAPRHQERLFGDFERASLSLDYPGTGLGLAIVRRSLDRLGGRVGMVSQEGRGSRFWFELPAADREIRR